MHMHFSESAWNYIQFHLIRFIVDEWNFIHHDLMWRDQNSEISTIKDTIKYEQKYIF